MIKLPAIPALFAVLASICFFAPTVVAQNGLLTLKSPSATGSFLAGREAMGDLDTERAARYFMDAAESDWDNAAIVQRSFIALAAEGRIGDAADLAQHLLELDAANPLARLLVGTVALKERRYASAEKLLAGAGQDNFLGITARILQAWALVGDSKFAASQPALEVLAQAGLEDFLVFHRTLMADVAGEKKTALALSEQAYANEPHIARIVEARARILANASMFDEAQSVLDNYMDQGLSHVLVTSLEADISAQKRPGKFAKSVQIGAAEMFHSIGGSLRYEGSSDLSALFLQLGLYLDPNSAIMKIALAELLESASRFDEANALYATIGKKSPLYGDAVVKVALNLDDLGDRNEAIRRLNNISSVQPDNLEAVTALADLLRFDERYEESVASYDRVIDVLGVDNPVSWRYLYTRGISLERSKRWPEAEADFLAALRLNPGQPQVLNYLGYSWVDQGLNLERALEMIQQAIEWDPSDGYVVDSLGWAYYRLGRMEEAVQTLEQAAQLKPNSSEVNDHLGDAYWNVGRKREARFQWKIAIDVDDDPESKISKSAQLKLVNGLVEDPSTIVSAEK